MTRPCIVHAASGRKRPGHWVVQFRVLDSGVALVDSAHDEHHPARQQGRRPVSRPRQLHAASSGEFAGHGVVQLCARQGILTAVKSAGDEHHSARQQGRRVTNPGRGHAAGGGECPGVWIV